MATAEGGDGERTYSVAVYCGSKFGAREAYRESAAALGREIARRGFRLVYGGGNVGLMGAVAEAARAAGGAVVGVIPEALVDVEVSGGTVGETIVVGDMHERKAKMHELADAFVALPGGFGTFEELFEMVTWQQLGFHRKPVGVLNVEGYYDTLLRLVANANEEGFISDENRGIVLSGESAAELLDACRAYEAPVSHIERAKALARQGSAYVDRAGR